MTERYIYRCEPLGFKAHSRAEGLKEMLEGKEYRIWYKDDSGRTRPRDIKVLKVDPVFIHFKNLRNGKTEGVSLSTILRYEEKGAGSDGN